MTTVATVRGAVAIDSLGQVLMHEHVFVLNEEFRINNELPFVFSLTGPGTLLGGDEPMTPLFIKDITEGIAGTGIKAAFLKCAVKEQGVSEQQITSMHVDNPRDYFTPAS
ncbi:hypothetical protein [Rudaeicoccus suwonensis]|uniref:Phosphotriesterase family protein n=1 Tax=Rudaeicoccus suwonensis TaxID=657409 RepID=A0A561E9L1_9MICO|nr:hypothetical protein [Rudaeicoccus suwonensis]TWE12277.1 hypothetical protein BKA23_1077 [Rudaeicoccus suwonensis]